MEQEILLTKQDIIEIEEVVIKNPALRLDNIISFGADHKAVYNVSPLNGLILIKGNIHTGFEHIHYRHEFWSQNTHKKNTEEEKLDSPNKFRPDTIPIIDYLKIADAVYGESNRNIGKNKRPELFDYYIGPFAHNDKKEEVFVLLTYKDSKIVHSLFPKKNRNNPKRPNHFKYKRGIPFAHYNLGTDIIDITIPYLNRNDRTVYSILFRRLNKENKEEIIILHHDKDEQVVGQIIIGHRKPLEIDDINRLLFRLKYTDLVKIEKKIMEVEEDVIPSC